MLADPDCSQNNFPLEGLITNKKITTLKEKTGKSDTIGGILVTSKGCWIATSSAGPWGKKSGRIGSSAIKGAGFDLHYNSDDCLYAAIATGHGEHIVET